jgi:SWI/SNF-related matrix-associated actin-dependent regulator of chromatin subfamily A3
MAWWRAARLLKTKGLGSCNYHQPAKSYSQPSSTSWLHPSPWFLRGRTTFIRWREKQTIVVLQAAISSSQGSRTFNALQRLNTLRLICSHGLLAQSNQGTETSCQAQSSAAPYTQSYLQDPFYEAFFVGRSFCCYYGMDLLEDFLEGPPSAGLYAGSVAPKSGPIICERCQIQFEIPETRSSRLDEILGLPRSPFSPLSQSPSPSIEDEQALFPLELMPTKVKALVTDLLHHSSSEKRWIPNSSL